MPPGGKVWVFTRISLCISFGPGSGGSPLEEEKASVAVGRIKDTGAHLSPAARGHLRLVGPSLQQGKKQQKGQYRNREWNAGKGVVSYGERNCKSTGGEEEKEI